MSNATLDRRRCGGMTLTEVVVASALLLAAVVPILKALTSAQVSSRVVEHKTRSLMLAQAKLDEIRARAFTEFSTSFNETSTALGDGYYGTVKDEGYDTGLKKITVTVGYDEDSDKTLDSSEVLITLTTLVAEGM